MSSNQSADVPKSFFDRLPSPLTDTILMRAFSWAKIPLIAFIQPKVVHIDEDRLELDIPLTWRTKNHLGSMYFGALAIGADLAGAYIAIRHIRLNKLPISFVFKDMEAKFLRRAEGNVRFYCMQGLEIRRSLVEAMKTGDRINIPLQVNAALAEDDERQIIAEFKLTLSVKKKS